MTRQNSPRDERSEIRTINGILRRLHSLETAPTVLGVWTSITLSAGYSAALTGAYANGYLPQYRHRSLTEVELRGTVQAGTGAGGAGANGFDDGDNVATGLPAPLQIGHGPIVGSIAGGAASYGTFRAQVTKTGVLVFSSGIAAAPGWIALDQFHYYLT